MFLCTGGAPDLMPNHSQRLPAAARIGLSNPARIQIASRKLLAILIGRLKITDLQGTNTSQMFTRNEAGSIMNTSKLKGDFQNGNVLFEAGKKAGHG